MFVKKKKIMLANPCVLQGYKQLKVETNIKKTQTDCKSVNKQKKNRLKKNYKKSNYKGLGKSLMNID